uniref:NADH-ubiquinone oxidoreductase chain 2 n=1 Tax=Gloeosoma sp. GLO01 TaxID=1205626 RepID=A0A0S2MRZ6_9CUCU|nr:NADH deshydrogenase subunit 2 [Gloeosoma sp. GLO01]
MKFWKILFLNILIMGTMISISSISWLSMWMGLEINLMAFIPLLINFKSIYSAESALKYFISQTLGSLILLFSMILNMIIFEYMIFSKSMILLINSALLLKMGAAPFHFWFPEIIEGLNWINILILLTWQKIAPMILLMYNLKLINFISTIIISSIIISTISSFNQISIRKILVFSSINHIGWMLSAMIFNQSIWLIYLMIYSLMTFLMIFMFYKMNCYFFNHLFLIFSKNKIIQILFFLNFFSLGGLPPFIGFFPKWITSNELMNNNFFIIFILIFFNLIMLYIYIRLMHNSILLKNYSIKNNFYSNNILLLISNLFFILLTPLIVSYF